MPRPARRRSCSLFGRPSSCPCSLPAAIGLRSFSRSGAAPTFTSSPQMGATSVRSPVARMNRISCRNGPAMRPRCISTECVRRNRSARFQWRVARVRSRSLGLSQGNVCAGRSARPRGRLYDPRTTASRRPRWFEIWALVRNTLWVGPSTTLVGHPIRRPFSAGTPLPIQRATSGTWSRLPGRWAALRTVAKGFWPIPTADGSRAFLRPGHWRRPEQTRSVDGVRRWHQFAKGRNGRSATV